MEAGMWWLQIGTNGMYLETLSWITRVDGFFTDTKLLTIKSGYLHIANWVDILVICAYHVYFFQFCII